MLALGEIRTGLLQHSTAAPPALTAQLLALVLGERVRQAERPIRYAVSPELLTGVDCRLPARSGARVRAVGTVVSRACITAGHVVQGSGFARVGRAAADRRLDWGHYLDRPGLLEAFGRFRGTDLEAGFTAPGSPAAGELDVGAIAERAIDQVQAGAQLDRVPPLRTRRTRLRWVAVPADPTGRPGTVRFTVHDDTVRSLQLTAVGTDPAAVAELAEDLALHDWLLTTVAGLVDRAGIGAGRRADVVRRLHPAIDHLLHLWMPAARVDRTALWEALERRPGFSRQWRGTVDRIRDQVAVGTLAALDAVAADRAGRP